MMPTPIGQEPQMIRTGTGRMVPVSKPFGAAKAKTKKFLVVIQHYDGDVVFAEELASLISDLERTRNHDADVLLVRRSDSRQMSTTAITKLQSKFDKVLTHQCRRFAKGYPYAPNEMWYDLVMLLGQQSPYRDDYYAFINLEPDAVPTRPGWIGELIAEWKSANDEGKAAVGYIHNNPRPHMNGLAVYAIDLYHRVGSGILRGGSPQVCYDIRHSASILPIAKSTPLIHFHYRHSTTTPAEVFAEKDGVSPAIFHGVKDKSAMNAVRDRHISMKATSPIAPVRQVEELFGVVKEVEPALVATDGIVDIPKVVGTTNPFEEPTKRANAYTYFHKLTGTTIEVQAILDLWRKGWATRGWNPVILTFADAVKNPKFEQFEAAISKLPCATGNRQRWAHQFYRWLALDSAGGGLMVDYDVLPGDFTPALVESIGRFGSFLRSEDRSEMFGAILSKEGIADWIEKLMKYDAQPEDVLGSKPHVTDEAMSRIAWGGSEIVNPSVVHFDTKTVGKDRKSVAMEKFLAGK